MTEATIWKRRAALMAVVGILVAIPVWLLIRGGGDGGDGGEAGPVAATTATPPQPKLGRGRGDQGLGVRYRVPEGWRARKQASAVRLTSGERGARIVVAAPAPASEADGVLKEAIAAFRANYDDVAVARGSGRKLGGLEAKGAVITARAGKATLRVLVAVAAGERRTYLTEVFTGPTTSAAELREAQVALNSLRFTH